MSYSSISQRSGAHQMGWPSDGCPLSRGERSFLAIVPVSWAALTQRKVVGSGLRPCFTVGSPRVAYSSVARLPHLAQLTRLSMGKAGAGVVVVELLLGRLARFPVGLL